MVRGTEAFVEGVTQSDGFALPYGRKERYMSRTFDVIIERQNGHYRATVPVLPGVAAEAASRNEALTLVWQAAEDYLEQVEVATIEVEISAECLRPGSPQAVLRAAAECRVDPNDELYQEYVANLEAEKRQQRQTAEREV
jgi:predicted RNase H-like HicB family nuclease